MPKVTVTAPIFDNRLIKLGLLKELKNKKYTIFARSIYLQGLFFKNPEQLPNNLEIAGDALLKLINITKKYDLDIANLALLYVRDILEVDSIVIRHENFDQISENLNILKLKPLSRVIRAEILEKFSDLSEKIINPSLWNR